MGRLLNYKNIIRPEFSQESSQLLKQAYSIPAIFLHE